MFRLRALAWAAAAALLAGGPGHGQEMQQAGKPPGGVEQARLGGAVVKLAIPSTYCAMDRERSVDARLLAAVEKALGGNMLVAMYSDCGQLASWRAGTRPHIDDYVQYQTLASLVDQPLPMPAGQLVKASCELLRKQGEAMMGKLAPDIKSRMESALANVKVNETRMVGVLEEDGDACYAGFVQSLVSELGIPKRQLGLLAMTSGGGKLIYYYLFAPYAEPQDMEAALTRHKAHVAAFIAANKG